MRASSLSGRVQFRPQDSPLANMGLYADEHKGPSRRRRWLPPALGVAIVMAGLGAGLGSLTKALDHDGASGRDRSSNRPFSGRLLIADRGNNRLLLVDSHKRILWRYP